MTAYKVMRHYRGQVIYTGAAMRCVFIGEKVAAMLYLAGLGGLAWATWLGLTA